MMIDLYFDFVSFSTFVVTFQFAFAQTMISWLFALYNFPRICQLVAEGNYPTLRTVGRSYNLLMVVLRIAYFHSDPGRTRLFPCVSYLAFCCQR
jgi:hypothetical protein